MLEYEWKGMRMQKAENILQAISKMGEKRIPLTRVYRNLYSEELYLLAYGKLYSNQGALTTGVDTEDTVDGMSLERIRRIISLLRNERYNFKLARRVYIPKKKYGERPLGLPTFTDKLVQEVVRMMLEAYYEPQFSDNSHGFRTGRGCHTALAHIKRKFTGTVWYIEGDIKGCFDNIDHDVLLEILKRQIQDGRFLNLIHRMLKAGYLEEWTYHKTYSGTPQGGVISPILANIYLNELDAFYENVLAPKYNYGRHKRWSKEYRKLEGRMRRAFRRGNIEDGLYWKKRLRQIPTQDTVDPDLRRLKYVRYADDFLMGFIGTKEEAVTIKNELQQFLHQALRIELNDEKTLITHARSDHARFLGYLISTYQQDTKRSYNPKGNGYKVRSINGQQRLSVPPERIDEYCQFYMTDGKSRSRVEMTPNSVAEIIGAYQAKYRGIAEYYKVASNRAELGKLKNVMQASLVKTLAHKLRISVAKVYRKYGTTRVIDGAKYRLLSEQVEVGDRLYEYYWGGISLAVAPIGEVIYDELPRTPHLSRNELVKRLTANTCEQCGATEDIEVHHIRKLSDLKKKWQGRAEKPAWVQFMINRNRKTMILCHTCHNRIHQGTL